MATATSNVSPAPTPIVLGDFGNGRFSPVMGELYDDSIRIFNFTPKQAHVTALRLGADLGRFKAGEISVKYGKSISKNGERSITVSDVAKMKIVNSWAISIAVLCFGIDQLRKQGLEPGTNGIRKEFMEFVNENASRLQ